jgi:uncharacterized protein (DUF302 family)
MKLFLKKVLYKNMNTKIPEKMIKNSFSLLIRKLIVCLFITLLFFSFHVHAEHKKLIMGRSMNAFPETMSSLQEKIKKNGYTISKVQRVDIGLTGMGFKTDKYRVVFFGKPDELKIIAEKYPLLIPYLPLAIAIFAEQEETLLISMSPSFLDHNYSNINPELHAIFLRWEKDIQTIIDQSTTDF